MLIRKLSAIPMLYSAESTEGTQPPPPASQQGQENGGNDGEKKKPAEITMTSSQLKKRLEEERAKIRRELLGELEAENIESAKELIAKQRQKDANQQGETQKLSEELASIKQALEAERQARADEQKQARSLKRDGELKALLNQAHDPNEVLVLLKAAHSDKVDALLDEHGNFKKADAETLIADYRKDKGHLFKDNRLGSAISNRDGRSPEPQKEAKEAAAKRTFRNMRSNV